MPLFPVRCVVVPVDFSESSTHAIVKALELVANPADVHVVHVVVPRPHFSAEGGWGSLNTAKTPESAERANLADYLRQHHVVGVTQAVRVGDPGFEIVDYAQKNHADLIVIPSHGYHGIQRLLLGSVAERVVRHAECAVLVLRRRDGE